MTEFRYRMLKQEAIKERLTTGRGLMRSVKNFIDSYIASLKTEADERSAEEEIIIEKFKDEHQDIKEIADLLAAAQRKAAINAKELGSQLEAAMKKIKRWLESSTVIELERRILEENDELMEKHNNMLANVSKLQKVYNRKMCQMEKTQNEIDKYPFGGQDYVSLPDLQFKMERLTEENLAARNRYLASLTDELNDRESFIKQADDVKNIFIRYEEQRMFTLVDVLGDFGSRMTNQNGHYQAGYNKLMELSMVYSPDSYLNAFLEEEFVELVFPVLQEKMHISKNTQKKKVSSDLDPDRQKLEKTTDSSGNADAKLQKTEENSSTKDCKSSKVLYMGERNPVSPQKTMTQRKRVGLPKGIKYNGYVSEGSVPNFPKDEYLASPNQDTKVRCTNPLALSLLPKPYRESTAKIPPSPGYKVGGFPQIDTTPEILTPRVGLNTPVFGQGNESGMEGDSYLGFSSDVRNHVPLSRRPKMDNNLFPHIPKSVLVVSEKVDLKPQSKSGDAPTQASLRTKSRLEPNLLPKMPEQNSMVSQVKVRPYNVKKEDQDDQLNWMKPQGTPSLPKVARPDVAFKDISRFRPKSRNDGLAITLPLMPKQGKNAPASYVRKENGNSLPQLQDKRNDGFSILPSKPKVKMDINDTQSLVSKSKNGNAGGQSLLSRHPVAMVRPSGRLDSGIPAGYRGNSSNKNTKSAALWQSREVPDCISNEESGKVGKKSESWMKNNSVQPNRASSIQASEEGGKVNHADSKDKFSNADRLLNKYDVKNLGIDGSEEDENLLKRADRLLAAHDIRNICSESLDEPLVED